MFIPELNMKGYSGQEPFRFWCQKVLPLVYDESLSYYELLCKMMEYINNTIVDVKNVEDNLGEVTNSYLELVKYVNDYFSNLDVQNEINAKLDAMATDGTLTELIRPSIVAETAAWLAEHITPTTPLVDDTLSIEGAAADSATVGKLALLTGNVTITHNNSSTYSNADNLEPNRSYNINSSVVSGDVENLPEYGVTARLIYINTASATNIAGTNNTGIQLYYTATTFWYRLKITSEFYAWSKFSVADIQNWVSNNNDLVMSSNISVNASNYETYQNIASLTPNRIYSFTTAITNEMINYLPTDAFDNTGHLLSGHMIIFASTYPDLSTYTGFVLYMNAQGTWFRTKTTSTFSAWQRSPYLDASLTKTGFAADAKIVGDNAIMSSNITISSSNYSNYDDADNFVANRIYSIASNVTSEMVAHLPEYGVAGHLVYAVSAHVNGNVGFQLYITQLNTWCRVKASTTEQSTGFRDWYNVGNAYRGYKTQRDFINTYVDKTSVKFGAGSNVFVFGDSITRDGGNYGYTWISKISDFVNATLAPTDTPFVGTTYGVSGTGFVTREDSLTTITDQINGVSDNDWASCTLAIIAAGTNDYQSYGNWATYKNAILGTITAIRTKNANVPILFITPLHCRNFIRDNTCADIAACIADVARANLCSVINGFDIPIPPFSSDTFNDMTRPSGGSTDGLHPSATGIVIYAKSIISHVM